MVIFTPERKNIGERINDARAHSSGVVKGFETPKSVCHVKTHPCSCVQLLLSDSVCQFSDFPEYTFM